jgi:hypothetical protein
LEVFGFSFACRVAGFLKISNRFFKFLWEGTEVFLLLGEPDVVYEHGQNLRYYWRKVKAFWSVAVGTTGGGVAAAGADGEIDRQYVLSVSFDSSNRVSQVQLLKYWESVRW